MYSGKRSSITYAAFSACIVSFLFLSLPAHAFVVSHQIRPNSSFETSALAGSCSTMAELESASHCNPALFPLVNSQGVSVNVVGKSDGDSIDNGHALIFKPISEDLVRRLFQQRNFNSYSLNTELGFRTKAFEISYSPYFLLADIFIFNPAFPEISLNLVNRETLRLTSGKVLQEDEKKRLSLGASVYYYKHEFANTNFSLIDLSTTKPDALIKFSSTSGASGDFGIFYERKTWLISRFSLQTRNIASKVKLDDRKASSYFQQTNRFLFEPWSSAGIGKNFVTRVGGFDFNLEGSFDGYYQEFEPSYTTLSARYSLRLFSVLLAYSRKYQNAGLRFESQYFNVGLFYSRESDIGTYDDNPEHSVYTGIGIRL